MIEPDHNVGRSHMWPHVLIIKKQPHWARTLQLLGLSGAMIVCEGNNADVYPVPKALSNYRDRISALAVILRALFWCAVKATRSTIACPEVFDIKNLVNAISTVRFHVNLEWEGFEKAVLSSTRKLCDAKPAKRHLEHIQLSTWWLDSPTTPLCAGPVRIIGGLSTLATLAGRDTRIDKGDAMCH